MLEHINQDLDQQLQQLQLYCRHKSDHLLNGQYHSAFKGQGIEFDEVRPYSTGDDVRVIDWNVTARTGEVHIKRFHEERELNVILVVDNSPSFAWSSTKLNRQYVCAQFSGLIASSALANNDRVGLLQFSDYIDHYLPPARGRNQLMRCLAKILQPAGDAPHTSIDMALQHLSQLQLKRSIIVVISDFFKTHNAEFENNLAHLNSQHEVLAIAIDDPQELAIKGHGLIELSDSENNSQQTIDLSSKQGKQCFVQQMYQRIQLRNEQFFNAGVDFISHTLGDDPVESLLGFYNTRNLRVAGETGG